MRAAKRHALPVEGQPSEASRLALCRLLVQLALAAADGRNLQLSIQDSILLHQAGVDEAALRIVIPEPPQTPDELTAE